MNDYSQMSMVEVAEEILKQNEGKMKMADLLEATLKAKELEDSNNELATRLYLDITTSAKFVYMGDEEWDLKANRPIKEYDRDGSEFNSKEDLIDDEDETTQSFEDIKYEDEIDNFDDEDDDDEYGDDEDEDDDKFDEDDDEDSEYNEDEDTPKYHSDDEYEDEDGNILKRYSEDDDDFDEDKYNDYMDDFEDMYEDR